MKKKVLICILVVCVCIVVLFFVTNKKLTISSKSKNAIGETDISKKTYGYPLISLLSYGSNVISVDAGYYRFGDVNQDGVIDESDIDDISLMLNSQIFFSEGQKKLADVDESGEVDEDDIKRFKQYLKDNGAVKYDLKSNTLLYCFSKENDSSSCSWQQSNTLTTKEKSNYYVFVKQQDTEVISDPVFFDKTTMDEKNI